MTIIEIIDFARENFEGEGGGIGKDGLDCFPLDLLKSNPRKVNKYIRVFYILYYRYDAIFPNLDEGEVKRLFHGIFFGENCDWRFGHSVFEDVGVIKKNVDLLTNFIGGV